tara:strand:- start:123 stop:602 length:480 start_codon:yes stop_codon:yes gene_type:complete
MINYKKRKREVIFYDSIEEMPHRRYMKFNKEMMRANDVGNTAADIIKRINKAISYVNAKLPEKAVKELANAKMTYAYATNELEPKGLALAAMVKSINGVKCDDITTSGLQNTLKVLQEIGLTKKEIDDTTGDIKKKLKENSKYFFLYNLLDKISSTIKR